MAQRPQRPQPHRRRPCPLPKNRRRPLRNHPPDESDRHRHRKARRLAVEIIMPRLHKYRDRNACYVLTAIGGNVITYQLTPEGEKKLAAAGIVNGSRFNRAILLDLYRTGDAFTHGSGVDDPALAARSEERNGEKEKRE